MAILAARRERGALSTICVAVFLTARSISFILENAVYRPMAYAAATVSKWRAVNSISRTN